MSFCSGVGFPDSVELTTGGARFCGVPAPPLPNFASCCPPDARIYNGTEVVISNPGPLEGANSTTPYAGCISYCITDATSSDFGDCVRSLSNGVNLEVYCGGGRTEESASSPASTSSSSASVAASTSAPNGAFSTRLQVHASPMTVLVYLLLLSPLVAS